MYVKFLLTKMCFVIFIGLETEEKFKYVSHFECMLNVLLTKMCLVSLKKKMCLVILVGLFNYNKRKKKLNMF